GCSDRVGRVRQVDPERTVLSLLPVARSRRSFRATGRERPDVMDRSLGDHTVDRFGEVLAAPGPGPAAGSRAAVTTALADGLATKVARAAADRQAATPDLVDELEALRRRALVLADDDVAAFSAYLVAHRRGDASVEEIVQVPADIVTVAVRVA